MTRHRLAWVCGALIACSGLVACGSDPVSKTGKGSRTGGGGGGAAQSDAGTGFGNSHGNTGGSGSADDGGTPFVPMSVGGLRVEPAMATLTITDPAVPETQQFEAFEKGNKDPIKVVWSLDDYDLGAIDDTGKFTARTLAAGSVVITATRGSQKATAQVMLVVELSEDVSPVDPANKKALNGPPMADPGPTASDILYPYDGTMYPLGILAPVFQFSAGSVAPEAAKLTLRHGGFRWEGRYLIADATKPQLQPPQAVWDAALKSTQHADLEVEIVKAKGGVAYGPMTEIIHVPRGKLRGAVYYQTYDADALGLWSLRPGEPKPAQQIATGCLVCHSVSANGKWLATAYNSTAGGPPAGLYSIAKDGTITQTAPSPPLGGDHRGFGFAPFTPDGKYVAHSEKNFWGGLNLLAWQIDQVTGTLTQSDVVGMTTISALVPTFSPDGKMFAFTNGAGSSGGGTASKSVSVMDVSIDHAMGAAGTLTFSNQRIVLDNGSSGAVTKFVTFLPDTDLLVLQEATVYWLAKVEGMMPSADGSGYGAPGSDLWMINHKTMAHTNLTLANTGNVPRDLIVNLEPFSLPVKAAENHWVIFTSFREYGNTFQGADARKQCWVFAIDPDKAASDAGDPSYPPFYLPNQTPTINERCFWALEPCTPSGEKCDSSDDCCGGTCGPSDPTDPKSPKICDPPVFQCQPLGMECAADAECCSFEHGAVCTKGKCGCVNEPAPDGETCVPPPSCQPQGGACKVTSDCCNADALGIKCQGGLCVHPAPT